MRIQSLFLEQSAGAATSLGERFWPKSNRTLANSKAAAPGQRQEQPYTMILIP